jgi:TonB-linked SusC/RagA family outer membrane protein
MPVRDIAGNFTGNKAAGFNMDNPVADLTRVKDNYNKYMRLLGSIFIEIDFFKDLTFKSSFSPNLKFTFKNTWYDEAKYENLVPGVSNLSQYINNSINWTWYNTLTYSKTFSGKHDLIVLAGSEAIDDQTTWHSAKASKFYLDDVPYRVLDRGEEDPFVSGNYSEWSMFSIFARVDYNFRSKYIVSSTVRRDGSSRFGSENKYGVFPAFSAAWRVSSENFMRKVDVIDDLKIRAGWGQTGNQNIGNYRIKSSFGTDIMTSGYSITGAPNQAVAGLQSQVLGNPNAKWETTTTTNVGLDLAMFNNSLTFIFDWYSRNTEDLLLEVEPSTLLGRALPPYENIGKMKNSGIDFSLFYHSPTSKKFTWDIGINFTHYKNEVTQLENPDKVYFGGFGAEGSTNLTLEGHPISSFHGLNILGIYQNEEDVLNGPKYVFGEWIGDTWVPDPEKGVGRWIFEDHNQNDSIDHGALLRDDRIILGSPHPDFTFGIPMNFRYKGFDLLLFWYGSYGNEICNLDKRTTDFLYSWPSYNVQFSKRMLQAWGMPGIDNSKALLPEIKAGIEGDEILQYEYFTNTSYFIEDGSYLRLSQLILGYNFNTSNWQGIEKFRIYFQADNIFTITNYQGIDPAITRFEEDLWDLYDFTNDFSLGVDFGQYPVPKSFLIGINITL